MEILTKTGVYQIINTETNDFYVGSTTQSFEKRRHQHFQELQRNKHKNVYLQNSFNKYGINKFVFEIIEVCENTLEREQFYMDTMNPTFNINPIASGTPNMSKETVLKRSITFKKTYNDCLCEYRLVKSGELELKDVTKKCFKIVDAQLKKVIWNKGLTKDVLDYSYLKVPKTKTEQYYKGKEAARLTNLGKAKPFFVYSFWGERLGSFDNVTTFAKIGTSLNFPKITVKERIDKYAPSNIYQCLKGNIRHYKGLIFSYDESVEPLNPKDIHPDWLSFPESVLLSKEIWIEKRRKFDESCDTNIERGIVEI